MSTMTDTPVEHEHLHNVEGGREYRNGRGKVLRHGDRFKVTGRGTFAVTNLFVERGQVYVTGYGGKQVRGGARMSTRTFHVDQCTRILKGEDPLENERHAVKDASDASKRTKRPSGWS